MSVELDRLRFENLLFLCVANSARSQMAEALARARFGGAVSVQSAGSRPTKVNPFAIEVLREIGVSMEGQWSKSVDEIDRDAVELVVTLCAEEVCPVFLADVRRLHWPIADPDRSGETLSDAERLAEFRRARDAIRQQIEGLAARRDSDLCSERPSGGSEPHDDA